LDGYYNFCITQKTGDDIAQKINIKNKRMQKNISASPVSVLNLL
jgi:hypothetical protein